MDTHVEDNLIQINDFVNEQGYRGSGQKIAADRLLYTALTFFLKKVFNFSDLFQTEGYAVLMLVIERKANSFFSPCELSS